MVVVVVVGAVAVAVVEVVVVVVVVVVVFLLSSLYMMLIHESDVFELWVEKSEVCDPRSFANDFIIVMQKICRSLIFKVRFAKYLFLELFFLGDTQGITQGAGSNDSVENTGGKVETTSTQCQTQHVPGYDVVDSEIKSRSRKSPCMLF